MGYISAAQHVDFGEKWRTGRYSGRIEWEITTLAYMVSLIWLQRHWKYDISVTAKVTEGRYQPVESGLRTEELNFRCWARKIMRENSANFFRWQLNLNKRKSIQIKSIFNRRILVVSRGPEDSPSTSVEGRKECERTHVMYSVESPNLSVSFVPCMVTDILSLSSLPFLSSIRKGSLSGQAATNYEPSAALIAAVVNFQGRCLHK